LNYFWTDCPNCHCQVAVHSTAQAGRILGSVRRWSTDRSTNDGRPFEIPSSELREGGGFATPCVCGHVLAVPPTPSAVGGERAKGLRVDLES